MDLSEKVASLPDDPGVYLFKDVTGTILYIGKARELRQRVKSYFLESHWTDAKTGSLVREIADVEFIVVDNEAEALALENNLIKEHQPKFNVMLRDDKTYPYIRYTAFEKFPRVYVTRRLKKDGSIYFGPYFPSSLAYRIVHFIHKRFRVPSCTVDLTRAHPRPMSPHANTCDQCSRSQAAGWRNVAGFTSFAVATRTEWTLPSSSRFQKSRNWCSTGYCGARSRSCQTKLCSRRG